MQEAIAAELDEKLGPALLVRSPGKHLVGRQHLAGKGHPGSARTVQRGQEVWLP
jgi:hypothetical protein